MRRALRDPQFWLAAFAAVLLWLLGYLWLQPEPALAWPLQRLREALFVVLVYPLVEEWLFRGLLQGRLLERPDLRRKAAGLTRANLLTSLVFTGLHFIFHPPLAAAAVMIPSLIFGHFRDRHGSLHAPILLHMYYNLGYFWIFASRSSAG
ncbi:MAG: JDVT-CTERM system glutamic-type intramembrane protease [Thiohalobacteraceae bacterium]